jgi:hypothetical protein
LGSKVPIYVHEEELKEAFWISKSVFTEADSKWRHILLMLVDMARNISTSTSIGKQSTRVLVNYFEAYSSITHQGYITSRSH